jgi:hypothetical protein
MQNEKEPGANNNKKSTKKNGHAQEAAEMLNIQADELREKLSSIDTQLRSAARQRPVAMICGALVAGYVIGRIVSH